MAYSNNTIRRAEQILGYSLSDVVGIRTYTVVDTVIYTGVYTGVATIPGYTGTLVQRFNGDQNFSTYYNEILLPNDCMNGEEVVLNLTWGSTALQTDILPLLDWMESQDPASILNNSGVEQKKIEDFSITFSDSKEAENATEASLSSLFGFYIRKPLIIGVSPEQLHDYRYF